jgi:hypothetical protein
LAVRLLITDVADWFAHTLQLTATETIMSHHSNQDKTSNELLPSKNTLLEPFWFRGSRISSLANLHTEYWYKANMMLITGMGKYKTPICETILSISEEMDYLSNSEISFYWSFNLQKDQ